MDKVLKYMMEGGTEADKQAASMEYLEGVLQGVLRDLSELDTKHKNLRDAVKELLDIIDQEDTTEVWQVALLKVQAALL